MKKILICTDHGTLADAVSKWIWITNRNYETATLVGKASEVTGRIENKVREFNPDYLIASYSNPIKAHEAVINEAKAANGNILAYALCGHPDVLDKPGDYQVFPHLFDILREIGVAEAA